MQYSVRHIFLSVPNTMFPVKFTHVSYEELNMFIYSVIFSHSLNQRFGDELYSQGDWIGFGIQ